MQIFDAKEFQHSLLCACINYSFENMTYSFKVDCVQHNPHLMYLKLQPLFKASFHCLHNNLDAILSSISLENIMMDINTIFKLTNFTNLDCYKFLNIMSAVAALFNNVADLEMICLGFVEQKFVEKFFKEHLIKPNFFGLYLKLATVCMIIGSKLYELESELLASEIEQCFRCADTILKQKAVWNVCNNNVQYKKHIELMLYEVYVHTKSMVNESKSFSKNGIELEKNVTDSNAIELYKQAAFVAKFIEVAEDTTDYKMYKVRT